MNLLSWLLVILINCMIFQSLSLEIMRMSIPAVSFFVELECFPLPRECLSLNYDLKCFKLAINIAKSSNSLKQFVGKLPTNCLSVFGYFVGLALKGLMME